MYLTCYRRLHAAGIHHKIFLTLFEQRSDLENRLQINSPELLHGCEWRIVSDRKSNADVTSCPGFTDGSDNESQPQGVSASTDVLSPGIWKSLFDASYCESGVSSNCPQGSTCISRPLVNSSLLFGVLQSILPEIATCLLNIGTSAQKLETV